MKVWRDGRDFILVAVPSRSNQRDRSSMFVHLLTIIHSLGAIACLVMAAGSAVSPAFRESLAISEGSEIMLRWFGEWTWVFLLFVASFLTILAWGSFHLKPWAWHLTLIAYSIGVAGSLWQVSVGIERGWVAAAVNGAVVAIAARPGVKRTYGA